MIKSYFTDIFQYEKFPVEFECYKMLLLHEARNEDSNINYIAVPWTQILNTHWLDFPGSKHRDYYLKILSKEKIDQQDNITVCQHDSYLQLKEYFKHLNITKVFSCANYTYDKMDDIEIVSMPYINIHDFNNTCKDVLVSFLGSITHDVREKIKQSIINPNIIFRDTYHISTNFSKTNKIKEEKEYIDLLSRSRFSLCPRGSNPNTVRFWESLAAGAIPVLISDDYALPSWDWDNTIIRISEKDISTMNYNQLQMFLENISNEDELRKNCYRAYKRFGKENFKNYILANV